LWVLEKVAGSHRVLGISTAAPRLQHQPPVPALLGQPRRRIVRMGTEDEQAGQALAEIAGLLAAAYQRFVKVRRFSAPAVEDSGEEPLDNRPVPSLHEQ
jgi:hypothetical protein